MRIGIDVRYLSHGLVGGVHTYVAQIVPALIEQAAQHEIVLYADTKRPFELAALPPHVTLRRLPYTNALSSLYNDLFMWRQMERDKLDLVHFTGNYGFGPRTAHTVITLQDEINLLPLAEIVRGHRKNARTIAMMAYLHAITRAALRRADMLLTISDYSKRQICRYSTIDPSKVVPIPHGCPTDMQRIADTAVLAEVHARLGLTRPFVLAEAYKNPAVLVRAWKMLPTKLRDSHEIVFFSRSPEVLPVVYEAIDAGFARMFVRPARRDLSALYTSASAFVFPSWIEGFGIPLVEAMTCGAPVIASDRGAIPEVVGDAALLIDAEDEAALAQHLALVLHSPDAAQRLRERGFERAARFSWRNSARAVLSAYEHLAHSTRPAQLETRA